MYNEITVTAGSEKTVITGYWVYSITQGILSLCRFDRETSRPVETRVFNRNAWTTVEMRVLANSLAESTVEFEGVTLRVN